MRRISLSEIIREINEEMDCDEAYTNEIDHRIGCYDDDAKFLRYRSKINEIEIYIVYNFEEQTYYAFFRRNDGTFKPKETSFSSKTWEILIQHLEVEMRTAEFARFLGITAKKKMLDIIKLKRDTIFPHTP